MQASAKQAAKQWRKDEQALGRGLLDKQRRTRLEALQRATVYFRVARNFPTAFDTQQGRNRLEPALDILEGYRTPSLTANNLLKQVTRLRYELADAYGKKDLLSAATKLLWLLHQHPVVIYDNLVRRMIAAPPGDYATYIELWEARYQQLEPRILRAIASLPRDPDIPTTAEWFPRRVLDLYLWNKGKRGESR